MLVPFRDVANELAYRLDSRINTRHCAFLLFFETYKKITEIYILYNNPLPKMTIFLYFSYKNKEIKSQFQLPITLLNENATILFKGELFFFTKISVH